MVPFSVITIPIVEVQGRESPNLRCRFSIRQRGGVANSVKLRWSTLYLLNHQVCICWITKFVFVVHLVCICWITKYKDGDQIQVDWASNISSSGNQLCIKVVLSSATHKKFVEIPNIAMSTIWDSDAVIMGEKHQSFGTAEFYLSTRYTPPPFMATRWKKAMLNLCLNLCPPSKQEQNSFYFILNFLSVPTMQIRKNCKKNCKKLS